MKIPNPTTAGATTAAVVVLKDLLMLRGTLQQYHPLVIEGHMRDTRDPSLVADKIVHNLQQRWEQHNMTKPILLLSQGDPLTERGISAITRHVATSLGLQRCLVCLDAEIDPHHSTLADRQDVLYEMQYSQLLEVLQSSDHHDYDDKQKKYTTNTDTCTETTTNTIVQQLSTSIDDKITIMNAKRSRMVNKKEPLASWYKDYAMLQEVTKAAIKIICGGKDLTLAHTITVAEMEEFSVTSFYTVGLELGLIQDDDILPYS